MFSSKNVSRIHLCVALTLVASCHVAAPTVAQQCVPPPDGLASWWPGDGDAADIAGGNGGTLLGGTTFATGLVVQAFSFDGMDDFVNVPPDPTLDFGTDDFTVDLWLNFSDLSGEQVVIEKYIETFQNQTGIPRSGWGITKLSGNTLRLYGAIPTPTAGLAPDVAVPIVVNAWHHLAIVRGSDVFTIWWDATPVVSGSITVDLDTTASLKFGHRGNPADTPGSLDTRGFYLVGLVDEVEIFNRALSPGEILDIFTAGSAGKCKDAECDPSPLSQGYWHRQCMGAGLITPGRDGRGPQEPLEPNFVKDLIPTVDRQLASVFQFRTCEDGMDAAPPSDKCEKAIKQYAALLLNLASGRLQNDCEVDLSAEGCLSVRIAGPFGDDGIPSTGDPNEEGSDSLVFELVNLIQSQSPGNCQIASDCAAAVNEGTALLPGMALGSESLDEVLPEKNSTTHSIGPYHLRPTASSAIDKQPAAFEPAAAAPARMVGIEDASDIASPGVEETSAETDDTIQAIRRMLAVLANASVPPRAGDIARDALLEALGGGYELDLRLTMVKGLIGKVDVAYHSLLARHLADIRDEALELGQEGLAGKAERLLKRLDPTEE